MPLHGESMYCVFVFSPYPENLALRWRQSTPIRSRQLNWLSIYLFFYWVIFDLLLFLEESFPTFSFSLFCRTFDSSVESDEMECTCTSCVQSRQRMIPTYTAVYMKKHLLKQTRSHIIELPLFVRRASPSDPWRVCACS